MHRRLASSQAMEHDENRSVGTQFLRGERSKIQTSENLFRMLRDSMEYKRRLTKFPRRSCEEVACHCYEFDHLKIRAPGSPLVNNLIHLGEVTHDAVSSLDMAIVHPPWSYIRRFERRQGRIDYCFHRHGSRRIGIARRYGDIDRA